MIQYINVDFANLNMYHISVEKKEEKRPHHF